MSGPTEPTGLCANHGVTEASGKVSHAQEMTEFNQTITAQNGPGRLWIVGEDAILEPEPQEGLAGEDQRQSA
jgi:hypothetical protein